MKDNVFRSRNFRLVFLGALVSALGALISHINIASSTAMMRIVDRDKRSKVNSITSIGSQGMIPIASVLAGAVLQSMGSTVLLFACSPGFAATAVLLLLNRNVREL